MARPQVVNEINHLDLKLTVLRPVRDIGDILGSSPATVKKHLERVYEKLGVETRTAAAAVAMQRVRELNPA